MNPPNIGTLNEFAEAFAGENSGLSGREICLFFERYSTTVRPYDSYSHSPGRKELFLAALSSLLPKEQYYSLNDICIWPPDMKYACPSPDLRDYLRERLHSQVNLSPIGLSFSRLREHSFRIYWYRAQSKISLDPAAAITTARSMLETVFKTIISERGATPDESGDVGRLLKQAQDALSFVRNEQQERHRILSGLTNVVNGVAGLSNAAGDRHGLVDGAGIDDPCVADFVVNAAGTVGLLFIELHLLSPECASMQA